MANLNYFFPSFTAVPVDFSRLTKETFSLRTNATEGVNVSSFFTQKSLKGKKVL